MLEHQRLKLKKVESKYFSLISGTPPIFLVITVLSCSSHSPKIPFLDIYNIRVNENSGKIVEDASFRLAKANFHREYKLWATLVRSTVPTFIEICPCRKLSKGDIVFLLIDQIQQMPYAYLMETQFCLIEEKCSHYLPMWLFDVLDKDRNKIANRLENCLDTTVVR